MSQNMKKGNHSVHLLQYHVIFVTKYRKPFINEEIGSFMLSETKRLLELWEGELIEGNTDKDHIHLLISMHPKMELAKCMGSLKNTLARNTRKLYREEIDCFLWGGGFWSQSYYIASCGGTNLDAMKKYIQDQGKPKRKYTKHS